MDALEWVYEECVKEINASSAEPRCDPGCPGWAVFDEDRGMGRVVQRCDSCKMFLNDDAAMTYAMIRLQNAMTRRRNLELTGAEDENE
jgi:hypothetical protein